MYMGASIDMENITTCIHMDYFSTNIFLYGPNNLFYMLFYVLFSCYYYIMQSLVVINIQANISSHNK